MYKFIWIDFDSLLTHNDGRPNMTIASPSVWGFNPQTDKYSLLQFRNAVRNDRRKFAHGIPVT